MVLLDDISKLVEHQLREHDPMYIHKLLYAGSLFVKLFFKGEEND